MPKPSKVLVNMGLITWKELKRNYLLGYYEWIHLDGSNVLNAADITVLCLGGRGYENLGVGTERHG